MGDSEESFGGEDMAIDELAICPRETVDEAEADKGDEDKGDEDTRYEEKETDKVDEYEELVGKYEYEIEEDVADFVDEDYRERHSIPESDDEGAEDEDEFVFTKRRMGKEDKLALGYSFYTGYQFKQAMLEYALSKARNIKQGRWEKNKLSFICGTSKKCKWRVYYSFDKGRGKWIVKTRYPSHSCTKNGKCLLLKGPVIANLFMDKLRLQPDCMPQEIQRIIKEKWKIVSTRDQCQRGRLLALKMLEKEYAEQFAHLRGFAEEIMFTNKGSTAIVETYPNSAGEDVFDRFYVCIQALKSSWSGCCRPIIGLDGTFLKADVKGVILTAVGHDGNNQIYPIVWAVVQRENVPNWLWFVNQLKINLNLQTGNGIIILSDRAKGLINVVSSVLPSALPFGYD